MDGNCSPMLCEFAASCSFYSCVLTPGIVSCVYTRNVSRTVVVLAGEPPVNSAARKATRILINAFYNNLICWYRIPWARSSKRFGEGGDTKLLPEK